MKILFILPEYYPHSGGGISTYYQEYIRALVPQTEKIKVIVGSGFTQSKDTYIYDGIEIEYLKPELFEKYLLRFNHFDFIPEYKKNISAAWAMFEQSNYGTGYDIVECVDFGLGFIPWVLNKSVPVVTRLHGSSGQIDLKEPRLGQKITGDYYRQTELILLPLSDYIITYSKENQLFWAAQIPECEICLIYPIYQRIAPKVSFGKNNNGIVTARVQNWKGPEILCKALSETNYRGSIYWYGRDTMYDDKSTTTGYLSKQYPGIWGQQIIRKEAVPNQEILVKQQESMFGLVPSTWDMFNFTCIEFLANGIIVIVSNGAGASEIIEDNVNGFKYDPYDHQALAECIEKIYALNDSDYNKIAEKGKESVKKNLSALKLIPQNMIAYGKALKNFKKKESVDFLKAIYFPSISYDYLSIALDKLPLKKLTVYLYKRVKHKIYLLFWKG